MEKNRVKVVDTRQYISVLRELVEEGREVSMRIAGSSMSPFLCHNRDFIYFKKPERKLRKGDMVFYQRKNGQYVMHRICKVSSTGYYLIGDAQSDVEGPIYASQIFAIITKIQRKGRWIRPGDFWWEFFEHIWIHLIPWRNVLLKNYNKFMKKY